MRQWDRASRLPVFGRYTRATQQLQYSLRLARFISELDDQPDVIEFAEVNAEGWAYLQKRKRQPVVVRCHTPTFVLRDYYDSAEMRYDTSLTTRIEKNCIKRADALSTPSADMAKTIARHVDEIDSAIAM